MSGYNVDQSKTQTVDYKIHGSGVVYDHVCDHMNNISDIKLRLRKKTAECMDGLVKMLSAPDQCELMAMLVKISNAKKGIEIGVFTGYSALCFASALPADGRLIALDVSEEFVNVGRPFWKEAGVDSKIDVRIAPALESLKSLSTDTSNLGTFDFVYIDADKPNYSNYVTACADLLKSNGFIIIDNVLWKGKVADPNLRETDSDTKALHECVQGLLQDDRFEVCTIMLADGITFARKR